MNDVSSQLRTRAWFRSVDLSLVRTPGVRLSRQRSGRSALSEPFARLGSLVGIHRLAHPAKGLQASEPLLHQVGKRLAVQMSWCYKSRKWLSYSPVDSRNKIARQPISFHATSAR